MNDFAPAQSILRAHDFISEVTPYGNLRAEPMRPGTNLETVVMELQQKDYFAVVSRDAIIICPHKN